MSSDKLKKRKSMPFGLNVTGLESADSGLSGYPRASGNGAQLSPPEQRDPLANQQALKQRRFSRLRLRQASDPELLTRFRNEADEEQAALNYPLSDDAAPGENDSHSQDSFCFLVS